MLTKPQIWALPLLALTLGAAKPVPYVDAHSHLLEGMTPAQEIAEFRKAGLARVIIMDPREDQLKAVARANRGYVVPFISLSRLPEMAGLHIGPQTAAQMAALVRKGGACGMGEIPTRSLPRSALTDGATLLMPDRMAVYAEAGRLGVPVTMHVDIANEEVSSAIDRLASAHPRTHFILAHAGWSASAETIGKLLADHANLATDLSVRLDPLAGLPPEPVPLGGPPPGMGNNISILQADGAIRPEWRALIERFPDRFLFGMDVTLAERPHHMAELLATARKALSPLGGAIENAVAHGNIERLIGACGH